MTTAKPCRMPATKKTNGRGGANVAPESDVIEAPCEESAEGNLFMAERSREPDANVVGGLLTTFPHVEHGPYDLAANTLRGIALDLKFLVYALENETMPSHFMEDFAERIQARADAAAELFVRWRDGVFPPFGEPPKDIPKSWSRYIDERRAEQACDAE